MRKNCTSCCPALMDCTVYGFPTTTGTSSKDEAAFYPTLLTTTSRSRGVQKSMHPETQYTQLLAAVDRDLAWLCRTRATAARHAHTPRSIRPRHPACSPPSRPVDSASRRGQGSHRPLISSLPRPCTAAGAAPPTRAAAPSLLHRRVPPLHLLSVSPLLLSSRSRSRPRPRSGVSPSSSSCRRRRARPGAPRARPRRGSPAPSGRPARQSTTRRRAPGSR